MTKPQPTLRSVALAAGVSRTTASDALRGTGRVSEATRRRVLAAATHLGYRVSATAQALRSGPMPQLLFELDSASTTYDDGSLLQFWHRVLTGFVSAAGEQGFHTVVGIDSSQDALGAMAADAMVYASLRPERLQLPDHQRFGSLFCFADTLSPPQPSDARATTMAVGHDQRQMGAALASHLRDLGHVRGLVIVRSDTPVRAGSLAAELQAQLPDTVEVPATADLAGTRDRICHALEDRHHNAVLDLANLAPVISEAVGLVRGYSAVGRPDGVTLIRLSEVPPWHLRDERVMYLSPEGLPSGAIVAEAVISALSGAQPQPRTLPFRIVDPLTWSSESTAAGKGE